VASDTSAGIVLFCFYYKCDLSVFNCIPYAVFDIAEKQKGLKGRRRYIERSASK
jgi:hypothetical protein